MSINARVARLESKARAITPAEARARAIARDTAIDHLALYPALLAVEECDTDEATYLGIRLAVAQAERQWGPAHELALRIEALPGAARCASPTALRLPMLFDAEHGPRWLGAAEAALQRLGRTDASPCRAG